MTAGQLNELCINGILDLCRLAGFYRPFVLCFDQTENYGKDLDLAKSLGKCIEVITREARNQMTVFTANAVPWNDAIRVHWQGAHLDRLSHTVELEGLDRLQARDLVTLRLQVCQAPTSRIAGFLDGGKRIDKIVGEKDRIGIRSFLKFCARSWEGPVPLRLSLGDLFREYCDKVASQPRRLEFNRDILHWLVQELGKGMGGVEVVHIETRPGQRVLCWRGQKQRILFDFEEGSHWQRWLKIAERAGAYSDKHPVLRWFISVLRSLFRYRYRAGGPRSVLESKRRNAASSMSFRSIPMKSSSSTLPTNCIPTPSKGISTLQPTKYSTFSKKSLIGYGSGLWNHRIRSPCRRFPRSMKSFKDGFARS
jgi:hypothetical protein